MGGNFICDMCKDPISGRVWRWEKGPEDKFLCEECLNDLARTRPPDSPGVCGSRSAANDDGESSILTLLVRYTAEARAFY